MFAGAGVKNGQGADGSVRAGAGSRGPVAERLLRGTAVQVVTLLCHDCRLMI
jgi:hypothetical protein